MSADDSDSEEVSTLVTMDDPSSSGKENQVRVKKEGKPNKNQKKKLRKKLKNQAKKSDSVLGTDDRKVASSSDSVLGTDDKKVASDTEELNVEIEYVADDLTITEEVGSNPAYETFFKVFEKFRTGDKSRNDEDWSNQVSNDGDYHKKLLERKKPAELELRDEEIESNEKKVSKRKQKEMTRMSVAELKTKVSNPELVEMHDVTSKDPLLLLAMKSTRNTVPVPRHWCFKRKYLQGKRGFEKAPFKLPEFIRRTGIMEMRESVEEKEDSKTLKTKQREKMRPKMGKIDIDYQKLHDAFFKWQTKPPMTIHGDLYYEGKEFETVLKDKKPGELSNDLRIALGMPTGPNGHKIPPPWLIAMQRYGPPPSYPNQKIPGLNAPIPDGSSFGYHAGGWGKPPVDEYGRPLYGDVFGISVPKELFPVEEQIDRTHWGQMDQEESEEEDESEEEEEEEAQDGESTLGASKPSRFVPDESGLTTPGGLATPGGYASSIPAGLETPGLIELRKRKIEAEMESAENPSLYSVIPEKKVDRFGNAMMGSTFVYDVNQTIAPSGHPPNKISGHPPNKIGKKTSDSGLEVALDPSELEMDPNEINSRLEKRIQDSRSHLVKESQELSDMVSRHIADSKKKNKTNTINTPVTEDSSKKKKHKDFKF